MKDAIDVYAGMGLENFMITFCDWASAFLAVVAISARFAAMCFYVSVTRLLHL